MNELSIHNVVDIVLFFLIFYFIGSFIIGIAIILRTSFIKSKILSISLILISSCSLIFFAYGMFIEPTTVTIKTESINLGIDEPFSFIIVSDLHLGRFNNNDRAEKAIELINQYKDIDYVFILGDVVNNDSSSVNGLDVLKEIDPEKEVFFVYGNHDYAVEYYLLKRSGILPGLKIKGRVEGLAEKLEELEIKTLENELTSIPIKKDSDKTIRIGGVDSVWAGKSEYSFLADVDEDEFFILLCHNPDCIIELHESSCANKVDLALAGHTHGGEMRFPLIGSLSPFGLPTQLPNSYDEGLHYYKDTPLFISSGVGNVGVRMRTFNPPEIVIITIN